MLHRAVIRPSAHTNTHAESVPSIVHVIGPLVHFEKTVAFEKHSSGKLKRSPNHRITFDSIEGWWANQLSFMNIPHPRFRLQRVSSSPLTTSAVATSDGGSLSLHLARASLCLLYERGLVLPLPSEYRFTSFGTSQALHLRVLETALHR